jgi:F-type H+-transporting ATPase subunit delta
VEVKASVDPDVIGGFYVLVDGHIFDGTVRTHLNNMKARLKRGIMNDS